MSDLVVRFLIGGVVVSLFAVIGDMLRPKSFAGLFGAAPSVALATLGLVFLKEGGVQAAVECRSMVLGSIAFFAYNSLVAWLLMARKCNAWIAAGASWLGWLAVAFGLWAALLR